MGRRGRRVEGPAYACCMSSSSGLTRGSGGEEILGSSPRMTGEPRDGRRARTEGRQKVLSDLSAVPSRGIKGRQARRAIVMLKACLRHDAPPRGGDLVRLVAPLQGLADVAT